MRFRPTLLVRQAARRGLAAALPRRLYLTSGPRHNRDICLTFDDGPHPEHTPRLLDRLGELSVPATFFLIGREAEKYPDLVRRMAAEGHGVGNHTYSHPARVATSARQWTADVARGEEVLAGILGWQPSLFRPPHGRVTAGDLWGLWRRGRTVVLWSVDPKDYSKPEAEAVRDWFRERPLGAGDLVLFHDNHTPAAAVLPELVVAARSRGFSFTTVDVWAGKAVTHVPTAS
jgi:peptidoglycan/xylan/chitin deacetylase (PgdA/CDA1 family)